MKQVIGLDIGRGYVKAYSNFNGKEEVAIFNSVYGNGRLNIDYASWKDPIALSIGGDLFFFGELAVKESLNKSTNIKDEKTTEIAENLLIAALSRIGKAKEIKIMLGVPNRLYNKRNREEVISKYKNKTYKFKDDVTDEMKEFSIVDIDIFRESDSALLYLLRGQRNSKPVGLITVGYRTTEITYYDPNFRFIDRNSTSIAAGQKDVNEEVRRKLEQKRIYKDSAEIDLSNDYDDKKALGYSMIENKIEEELDGLWTNLGEMEKIYICGGTSMNLKLDEKTFTKVKDPQLVTAKGLHLLGCKKFK